MGMIQMDVRQEIARFAGIMEKKMRAHDDDRGYDWKGEDWSYLIERMREEITELEEALSSSDHQSISEEAADVANFAMMISDIYG